jgi:hypothetical protein
VTVAGVASNAIGFAVLPNLTPVLMNPGDQDSAIGSTIGLRLIAIDRDADSDVLVYSVVGLPPSLSLDAVTGAISGTLAPGSTGTYPITAQVTDGTLSDSQSFTWTVSPVALDATPATVASGGSLTVNWQGISAPTPLDWVALVPVGAADAGYVTYWWMTGSSSGTRLVTLPASLPAGAYQLRLFANNSYQRLAVSNTVTLTGPGTILSANAPTLSLGGTLPISWQSIATPTPTDWIGVFSLGEPDTGFVTWWHTTGSASGSQLVTLSPTSVPTGTYQLRLFAANGSQRLAVSNGFNVTPAFSVNAPSVAVGGTLTASWQGIPAPAVNDWFGLFAVGAPDTGFVAWSRTTGTATGSTVFTVPASAPSGAYELRLFAQNGFQRLAVTGTFTVGPWLSASPSSVASRGTLTVNWGAITTPTSTDWFGLFPVGAPDTGSIASSVTTGATGGGQLMTVPASAPAGAYELRLFSQGSFQRLGVSTTITVTGPGPVLNVNSPTASPGNQITVGWQGISAPTLTDWFGLFAVGAPDTGFVTWWRTTGTATGSVVVTVPASAAVGAYELRLFAQNGFQRLALSNGLAVK